MLKILSVTAMLLFASFANADTIADTHTEMAGCESCHLDGEPSASMDYENKMCVECHSSLEEFEDENHKVHSGILTCGDCHTSHEEIDPAATCENCH